MHETFELYVRHREGHGRFHAVTCPRDEIITRAKELLDRSGAEEVDVRRGGEHLFTLAR